MQEALSALLLRAASKRSIKPVSH